MDDVQPPRDLLPFNQTWFGAFAKVWIRNGDSEADIVRNIEALRRNCPTMFDGSVRAKPFVPYKVNTENIYHKVNAIRAKSAQLASEYEGYANELG